MRRYITPYSRRFDRLMRGNFGLVVLAAAIVLWTLMLSGKLPT